MRTLRRNTNGPTGPNMRRCASCWRRVTTSSTPASFTLWVQQVGDDGVVMCHITQSPLKMLHWLAGPQNATRFIIDHPAETLALARIHEEKTPALLEVVYTCGRIRVLLPLMGASDVDCPEGITRAPLGDVQPGEARRLSGVDSPHLELREDGEVALPAYTRDLFAAMDDKRSLIYALDYMTSPLTPWKNLVYLRDAAHAYGTLAQ